MADQHHAPDEPRAHTGVEPGVAAAQHASELVNSFWAAQVLNAAASLCLPDHLAHGPCSADVLAAAAGAHAPSVFRLLRALVTLGICRALDRDVFELTDAGQYLRSDVPGSIRGRALFTGDMLWKQFEDLTHVVRTGGRTRTIATGAAGFAQLQSDPARLEAFQRAMAESSVRAAREVLRVYDFGGIRSVLDLGGGYGGVLAVLLARFPMMTGAVCDLAYLQSAASAYLQRAGVHPRGTFLAGDFFESVPQGYDAYLLKFVIHDWDDAQAARILGHCRTAARPATRLILLERVVPERLGTAFADQAVIRTDLTMMTVGGKERTAAEYHTLLATAGWNLTRNVPAGAEISVLEATPV
jgi:orsellinic acid C2-O-methyltransferase